MSRLVIKSKVTRNSENATVLRDACRKASADGREFTIVESYSAGNWWTEFEIEQPPCQHSFFAIGEDQMKCTFCGVGK